MPVVEDITQAVDVVTQDLWGVNRSREAKEVGKMDLGKDQVKDGGREDEGEVEAQEEILGVRAIRGSVLWPGAIPHWRC